MSIQPSNISINYSPAFIQLPDELWLKQLIEKKDEKAILTFLKQHCLLCNDELINTSIVNCWDDVLDYLFQKGVDFVPYLTKAIDDKDSHALEKLIQHCKTNINDPRSGKITLLSYALDVGNFEAADFLIKAGAKLNQPLPLKLQLETYSMFKSNFFQNKNFFGENGDKLLRQLFTSEYHDSLAYAIIFYYYPKNKEALSLLVNHPQYISEQVIKAAINLGDGEAFKQLLKPFLESSEDVEQAKGELLNHALSGIHFSLMGFNFDYLLQRAEVLKTILALNPSTKTLNKYNMTSFEIAQYLKTFFPGKITPEFESFFSKILEDSTGFHEIWEIQRLLVNCFGLEIPINSSTKLEIAAYPSVFKHFKSFVAQFSQQNHLSNEWVYVTPFKDYKLNDCLKMINEKKIVKFFTGWTNGCDLGHGINVVIYDKYLFVCNRGIGSTKDTRGICIYEIGDPSTLKVIVELSLERSQKTQDFFTTTLLKHPHLKLLKHVERNDQKAGNCVYLSDKMGIYACDIAEFLKKGLSLEEATLKGTKQFKKFSKFERLNLIQAYLNHPYHLQDEEQNKEESIIFVDLLEKMTLKMPERMKAEAFDLILDKLNEDGIKKALGDSHEVLHDYVISSRYEAALKDNDTKLAIELLDFFPDLNATLLGYTSLIHLACQNCNLELVKELIKRGANPNNCDFPRSALEEIFESDREQKDEVAKYMIEVTNLNELAKHDCFPLHTAIQYGYEFAVYEILKKGFDLNLSNEEGDTSFHYAAISKSESLAKYIFNLCKNLEVKNKDGKTPLYFAAKRCPKITKILLELGANPNAKTNSGLAPINSLFCDQQLEICQLLIEKGADVNNKGSEVWSPLMFMINDKAEAMTTLMLNSDKIDIHVEDVNDNGKSAISLAAERGMIKTVEKLLALGAKPKLENGNTLLHLAVSRRQIEMCEYLLSQGFNPNEKNQKDETPLDFAKLIKNDQLVALLSSK